MQLESSLPGIGGGGGMLLASIPGSGGGTGIADCSKMDQH